MIDKNELIFSAHDLNTQITQKLDTYPTRFNLLDIGKISENENIISDYLAYLLDRENGSKHNHIDSVFLEILKEKIPKLAGTEITYIKREKTIANQRRIDLLLITDKNEILIIENKVWADDQPMQLEDYYRWSLKAYPNSDTFLIYLSPWGNLPSDKSITKQLLEKLISKDMFTAISYESDILNFLSKTRNLIEDKETSLKSGLLQLEDSIAGLCNERKEDQIKETMVMRNVFDRYQDVLENKGDITSSEFMKAANIILYEAESISIIRFLIDLTEELSDLQIDQEIFFTHGQNRIKLSERESFYKLIEKYPQTIGVEVSFGGEHLGLGIEFSELHHHSTFTFGLMSHAEDNKIFKEIFTPNKSISTKLQLDFPTTKVLDSWWWEYVEYKPGSWFHNGLFFQSDWQKSDGSLASHIAQKWFLPVIEEFQLE